MYDSINRLCGNVRKIDLPWCAIARGFLLAGFGVTRLCRTRDTHYSEKSQTYK